MDIMSLKSYTISWVKKVNYKTLIFNFMYFFLNILKGLFREIVVHTFLCIVLSPFFM